jgi:transposase
MVISTGKPIAEVARDLGIHDGTLGNWVNAWRRENPEPDQPLSPMERAHVKELEAEVARPRMENEFLKKAAANRGKRLRRTAGSGRILSAICPCTAGNGRIPMDATGLHRAKSTSPRVPEIPGHGPFPHVVAGPGFEPGKAKPTVLQRDGGSSRDVASACGYAVRMLLH